MACESWGLYVISLSISNLKQINQIDREQIWVVSVRARLWFECWCVPFFILFSTADSIRKTPKRRENAPQEHTTVENQCALFDLLSTTNRDNIAEKIKAFIFLPFLFSWLRAKFNGFIVIANADSLNNCDILKEYYLVIEKLNSVKEKKKKNEQKMRIECQAIRYEYETSIKLCGSCCHFCHCYCYLF